MCHYDWQQTGLTSRLGVSPRNALNVIMCSRFLRMIYFFPNLIFQISLMILFHILNPLSLERLAYAICVV